MHPRLRSRVHALAAPREGVISRQILLRHGIDHELPSREVAAGRWQVLLPGVYLTSTDGATLTQRCHAAVLHGGRRAVLSGNAACVLRQVPGAVDDETVTLLVPEHMRRISNEWCHLVRTRALPDVTLLQGLPVAPVERAVADAVRQAGDLRAARALACAARLAVDWELFRQEAGRPVPSPHLGQVVRDLEDGVRSPAEGDLHDVVLRAAQRGTFPSYLLNPEVYLDGRLLGSPDLWVVGLGLGDEMDSRQWHEEEQALDRTLLRHEQFRRAGLHLAHVTPGRFSQDPAGHVAHLRALVSERAQLAHPEPAGLVVLGRGPLLPARSPWPQVRADRRGLGAFRRHAA
jgi:hypothetical protein